VMLGAAVSACNVIAGLSDDYRVGDGGTGPTGEGGGADGNADKDGALPDGFAPDGGADALPDQLVTDGGRFCDTVDKVGLDFCNDFEDGPTAATTATWTGIQNTLAATIKVVDNAGLNESSRGLDVDSASASTASRNIFLHKTLPGAKPIGDYLRYDVEFDFKLLASADAYVAVGVINFTGAAQEDHGVAAYPTDDVIGRLTPKTTGVSPAKNKWHHVHIVLSHATAGALFSRTITVDSDAGVVDNTASVTTASATLTELRMGIFYTGGAAGQIHVMFDNIVARRK